MADSRIRVPYNRALKPFEELLERVRRPGDFFVRGALELPMPRVEVEGAGVLSFPVPATQIAELVRVAERAPYGRGGETIIDTSIRRVWQVAADQVRVGGRSWEQSFRQILSLVSSGLGCAGSNVSADLYKLLVYEAGGFFKAHRDTEKAGGMFGTLVVGLPSAHRGGELVVRHAGREVTLDLSGAEFSELTFAAFYADCEHEVRPVTEGHRVCLVYNLVQRRSGRSRAPSLTAPRYDAEVAAAAEMLEAAFASAGAPAKLVWLLEHQYSPAGLGFAALKGEDAARADVLRRAAERARCAVHLAIVHIEEEGAADPRSEPDYRRGYRGRRYGYGAGVVEDTSSADFEVIEVSDARRFLDGWIGPDDRAIDFGELPLADGEVLPAGALDDEEPDEQRLTEATGNEGASFERSYHRAALVIWPHDRFADVLLQAGVGAALPYLADHVRLCVRSPATTAERAQATAIAGRIVDAWEVRSGHRLYGARRARADRAEMIRLLARLGDSALLERFIAGVVTRDYDGSESESLVSSVPMLGACRTGELLSRLTGAKVHERAAACVDLLGGLVRANGRTPAAEWSSATRAIAAPIVAALAELKPASRGHAGPWRVRTRRRPDAALVTTLLDSLAALEDTAARDLAAAAIVKNAAVFRARAVVVPALVALRRRHGTSTKNDVAFTRLWRHAADVLLARSEFPPEPPHDWQQEVTLACACGDCRELQAFARESAQHVHRFRVRKDRRQHLHQAIDRHRLDMTHATERSGSPQTLVCTKTLRSFDARCAQHAKDVAALAQLNELFPAGAEQLAGQQERMIAASRRTPRAFSPP